MIVETREQLIYLLAEAAEIEHGLMCCYLFAAFSLRTNDDSLPAERRATLARWRQTIMAVAQDEMTHLALVSNVLSAVGSAPHFGRANFPVAPGYHPAGIIVSLAPFDRGTLEHFIYLERPEGSNDPEGEGFAPFAYHRRQSPGRLVPSAQDYETIGQLYRGIRDGLARLSEAMGEKALFVGDDRLQIGAEHFPMAGLSKVRDLADAQAAIDTIVRQGEGTTNADASSHHARFVEVHAEYMDLLAREPGFVAARPVARNPVMRRPPVPDGLVWIDAEPAATILDLGNAAYSLMLRSLSAVFSPLALDDETKNATSEMCLLAMHVVAPVADHLTTLPASTTVPGLNAGLTFTMSRSLTAPPDYSGLLVIVDLARKIASAMPRHIVTDPQLIERGAMKMSALADRLEILARAKHRPAIDVGDEQKPAPARTPTPAQSALSEGVQEIRGRALSILYEGKRCIHSRHCVLESPKTFLANTPGDWIFPDATDVETLTTVARECVSGAIRYKRHDGGPDEPPPPVNVVTIRENGPLAFLASLVIEGQGAMFRATLCRCGASKNKPFCDSSHHGIDFAATGEPATIETDALAKRDGALKVTPLRDGPYLVEGPLELCAGTGRTVSRVTRVKLCRCGASKNKPFCDASHAKIDFRAEGGIP
jgi:CDGSH-type Zn-finger protein/uncharacterized Fe-S cluster protein YjdI